MIIKSLSRKTPSFAQLLSYMLAPQAARVVIRHNLPIAAASPFDVVRAFEENHALLPHRANGNALFHEVIALPPDLGLPVRAQVAALQEIAARYLDLRGPRQLALGVIHTDTAHVHLHLMVSSNAVWSRRREWLKKEAFAAIQREMEAFRLVRFPELGTARHYERGGRGVRSGSREQAARLRTGMPSHKEQLAAAVFTALDGADSREALEKSLAGLGLSLYRRGRSVGVQTAEGRRHRLATLGLAEAYGDAVARFELMESRLASLRALRGPRQREREWER